MKRSLIVATVVILTASAFAEEAPHCLAHAKASSSEAQPSAGEQTGVVKSLSDDDARALRSGAGMGLARPAELNHYPGPKHVIDLASELELSEQQLAATRSAFETMREDAVRLGNEIVAEEEALDQLFASGSASDEAVAKATAAIAALQGRLRATHLRAHLRMREIMKPEQIAKYDTLRGYGK